MTKTKKKSTKPSKPYWEMTTEELREATKEFDGPIDESQWRPMTKSERTRFERMQKGPHRSIFIHRPDAAKKSKVEIQLTEDLLKHCNEYASKHDLTVSDVIAMSLKSSFVFAE